jgi:HSP20 family protein
MLMRTDPFRELDRLTQHVFGNTPGPWGRPTAMVMDGYRAGDEFVVAFDLPGVSPDGIELEVEGNVLTVKAERHPGRGRGSRRGAGGRTPVRGVLPPAVLRDTLDTDRVDAAYDAGELRGEPAPRARAARIDTTSRPYPARRTGKVQRRRGRPRAVRKGKAAVSFGTRTMAAREQVRQLPDQHPQRRPPSGTSELLDHGLAALRSR